MLLKIPVIQPPQSQRFNELTALRGMAALGVLLFHYTIQFDSLFGGAALPFLTFEVGKYGVQLFFCISGFVIFSSLNQATRIANFAIKRAIRLYPPYWLAIALTFAVLTWLPIPGHQVSLRDAIVNLSMLQYWLLVPHVDNVYWTLSVELAFYFWMGFLRYLGCFPKIERFVSLLLAAIISCQFAESLDVHLPALIRTSLLLDHGHYFSLGIIFNKMKFSGGSLGRHFLVASIVLMEIYIRSPSYSFALAVIAVIGYAFIFGKLEFLIKKPLLFFGEISYPLYLTHQNIGYSIIWHMKQNGFNNQIWLLVPICISVSVSWMIARWIERPSLDKIKKLFEKSQLKG